MSSSFMKYFMEFDSDDEEKARNNQLKHELEMAEASQEAYASTSRQQGGSFVGRKYVIVTMSHSIKF